MLGLRSLAFFFEQRSSIGILHIGFAVHIDLGVETSSGGLPCVTYSVSSFCVLYVPYVFCVFSLCSYRPTAFGRGIRFHSFLCFLLSFRLLYASVTVLGSRKSPIVCSLPRISLHRPCTRESPKDWTIFSYSVFQLKYASFSMPVYVLPWPYRTRHTA